jgi:non-lysosomal glucosylceramidase
LPSNSTNGFFWKDLNAKFILLVYRDFLMTKDENFLKKMYPFVKKAFYWLAATDKNKDYLPDNEGPDQTFDLWNFYGANSYTSGIFLAGLLALGRMAELLQDEDMRAETALWFKKGRSSFEKKLWHKKYFIAYNNAKEGLSEHQLAHHVKSQKVDISCMAAQLNGQWIAHLLGLGYILPEEKVRRALTTILELNSSSFGAVNGVLPTGPDGAFGKDKSNLQSENIFFGVSYVLASLAIYEGLEKEGLALAKKTWDNAALNALNPWNQPDMCSSSDGSFIFGDHYMRNMVIWSLLFALANKDKNIAAFLEMFKK